jgi:hypothetical protein
VEVASGRQSGCKRPHFDSKFCGEEASNGSHEAAELRSWEAKKPCAR